MSLEWKEFALSVMGEETVGEDHFMSRSGTQRAMQRAAMQRATMQPSKLLSDTWHLLLLAWHLLLLASCYY